MNWIGCGRCAGARASLSIACSCSGTAGVAWLREMRQKSIPSNSASVALPAGNSTGLELTEPAMVKRRGWTFGGGAEYALTNNWSIKGE